MSEARDLIAELVALGVDPLDAGDVIARAMALGRAPAAEGPDDRKKRMTRERTQRWRERHEASQSVTRASQADSVTERHIASPERHEASPPRAHVRDKTLPSVEEDTSEPKGSSVIGRPSEKPPPKRGSRIAADWQPGELDVAFAKSEGLAPQEITRAVDEFRDYWTARSGRDAAKLCWSATWKNRVRELADRKRRYSSRLALGPAGTGGGGRGSGSFADIYARRHGGAAE